MNIVIKRASPIDADEILQYLKKVGGQTDNLTFGAEGMPFTVEQEAEFIAKIEHSLNDIMLTAKDGDKIVGVASLNRLPRRLSHRGDFGLSVLKEYWNKGIGSELLKTIIDFAKANNFEVIDLQVRSDNAHAIHVYKKYGFVKIGTHPAFHKVNNEYLSFDFMYLNLK